MLLYVILNKKLDGLELWDLGVSEYDFGVIPYCQKYIFRFLRTNPKIDAHSQGILI